MTCQLLSRLLCVFVLLNFFPSNWGAEIELLKVKPDREAIVKKNPTGNSPQVSPRLPEGTVVEKLDKVERYYSIRTPAGIIGWSYTGNFEPAGVTNTVTAAPVTKESLLARGDVLKIIILDVEVGDATLFICPTEDGRQDVILIDTGENDSDRIRAELTQRGINLAGKPITRFIVTHYDSDHMGDAAQIVPLAQMVYDHGNKNVDGWYKTLVSKPTVNRQTMTLDYDEQFSGGVRFECVAVNQATDFTPTATASSGDDNPNSIALIVSFGGFDYFTGGDLTFVGERGLTNGIRQCEVYHANHHGSRATSSDPNFIARLNPKVSVASNGTKHGHPSKDVAARLEALGSKFFQTNTNRDSRAHHPLDARFTADNTYTSNGNVENAEGAKGTIRIIVDPAAGKYYVLMPELPLSETTFSIQP